MAGIATLKPSTFHCFRLSSKSSPSSSSPSPSSLSFASTPLVLPIRVLTGTRRRPKFPKILAYTSNDIKVGANIEVDGAPWKVMGMDNARLCLFIFISFIEVGGAPWKVIEFLHVKPGKGAAFVRTTLRNYVTGNTVEKTFRAGAKVEQADIFKETKQYTYKDGGQFVLMDLTNYEEFRLDESYVGDKAKWMKEGMDCNLLFWNGKALCTVKMVFHGLVFSGHSSGYVAYKGRCGRIGFNSWHQVASPWCHCGMEFTGGGRGVVGCGIVDMVGKRVMRVYWGWNGSREDNELDNNVVIGFEVPMNVKLTVVDVDPSAKADSAQGGSKPATLETGAVVNVPLFIDRDEVITVDTETGQYLSRG
ncbi:hypothetical protein RHSIM_Rhsim04G0121700 [Rhododendron simsii]|uniref:Elongation factor P n=1 Tax=Rhododendron simsii TaxID=118357 RepID=A0A834LU09_RHOSS|nr:hypothetical protein RHSIM_Rhsim04G0121700 [Rhododendron simsii]